ncbi:MAG: VWA domain-containing protein [Phycisphaerales bacterium]|nr:VWA domain-containing protein [Phycisphaerales bacterium]MCB9855303.1 VWA domain-containing protein [Phycisphaerales bacterium]MCB9862896.1 VWA domain-containing protein [Phycisphaerales bacterium]
MKFNPLESQLERLARTLTDSFGISLICQGENAYTDGRKIVLPSLPDPMAPDLERMIIGFLDHESAHVVWSDFDEVARFNRAYPGCEAMLNVVEDALIEQRAMQRWPGVRANLDALFEQVKARVRAALRTASPFRRFCTAVYLKLSHHTEMLGLEQEIVGDEDLLAVFPQVRSTADSAALSEKLLARWLRKQKRQRQEDHQPAGPSASSAGEGDAETPGPGSAVNTTSTPGTEESASECGDAEEGSTGSNEIGDPAGNPKSPNESTDESEPTAGGIHDDAEAAVDLSDITRFVDSESGASLISEVVASGIERAVAKVDGDQCYRIFTRKHDRIELVPGASDADVLSLLARGEDEVRRLRRGLTNALRSAEKRWWREEQPRGALSPRSLHRLCLDRPALDVFRTRALVQSKSTAVSIVLDASGSMTPSKMDVARDAVRVLLQALSDLKIPTEAFTFTTGDQMGTLEAAEQTGVEPCRLKQRFTRLSNLEIGLIKRFEDSIKTAIQRLPSIRGSGLTPLGEAMEIGARRLIVRPETRKIQLVVTDGRPACEGSDGACVAHAANAAKRIAGAGIELVGVGIQDDSLQQIISNTIVVQRLEDLPAQLCKLLGRTLTKGIHHVG